MSRKRKHINYQEWLSEELQDPVVALEYLNEALKDEDQRVLLLALKDVIEARGNDMTELAMLTNLNRQNLYRILSKKGNPRWDSLSHLLNSLGYQVQLSFKNKN